MTKLLIVDDESDIREFAKRFFTKRGITVMTAAGGREAIALIEQELPDLVLLDIQMDDMDGIKVLEILEEKNIHVKIVVVSGNEEPEITSNVKQHKILGYIHKPLVLEELEKVVLKELQQS